VGNVGPQGHACWVYDTDEEWARVAGEFLSEGIALDQRLLYAAGSDRLSDVEQLVGADALLASGRLETLSAETLCAGFEARQQPVYRAQLDQSLAAGHRGLRVALDLSSLVSEGRRPGLVRWEQAMDASMVASEPLAVLCAYDRRVVGESVASLVATHPLLHAPPEMCPFQLYGEDDYLVLAGDLDWFSLTCLEEALDALPRLGGARRLHLGGLSFIDHSALLALDQRAAGDGTWTVVEASSLVRRLGRLLDLRHLVFEDGRDEALG
jgi:hypothetical protein